MRAQASVKPRFEVASVKVNTTNGPAEFLPARSGDHVQLHNCQIASLILYAYHVSGYQMVGNPRLPEPWNWYDIDAKVDNSSSDDEVRQMFQSLLEERFKLKVHRETRELQVYVLKIAKSGPKLKSSAASDYKTTVDDKAVVLRQGRAAIVLGEDGSHLLGKGVTVAQLAKSLEGELHGPVVDATGIPGTFDYDVVFMPDQGVPKGEFSAPLLPAALRSDLGLTVEKGKAPVEVLIIDHLEKPSPN
ncbi:MAG TPA: TIGR03435 family protein [Candidatus Acidoferrales bacterium]|nr:TIGR03435 family protein [Candidatus Acidoferrales bacterium]